MVKIRVEAGKGFVSCSGSSLSTYHLVNAGDLRLKNSDSITDGGFLVHLGSSSEGSRGNLGHVLSLAQPCEELGQHSRLFIKSLYFFPLNLQYLLLPHSLFIL